MNTRSAICLLATVALSASPAFAGLYSFEQLDLIAGRRAQLGATAGRFQFVKEAVLTDLPDPRCPSTVAVRWRAEGFDSGYRMLDCADWVKEKAKLVFEPVNTAGSGVAAITWKSTSLSIELGGDGFQPAPGNSSFVEIALSVGRDAEGFGPNVYCGRFQAQSASNGTLTGSAPSAACDPMDPPVVSVGTFTPTATPTDPPLGSTFTPTVTATTTRTPTPTVAGVTFRYRVSAMTLLDPGLYLNGTAPLTAFANLQINNALGADGSIELGLVAAFEEGTSTFRMSNATCASASSCASGSTIATASYAKLASGACLTANPPTSSAPIAAVSAPCFSSAPTEATLSLAGINIQLREMRLHGATPGSNPMRGVLIGFLSQSDAASAILPATLPVVGGQPMSSLLIATERDLGPDGVTPGWWFHIGVTGTPLP